MAAAGLGWLSGLFGVGSAAMWRQIFWSPRFVGCRRKSTKYLTRPDQPKLAYKQIKGKSPGVLFVPGFATTMKAEEAVEIEKFCTSLGHSFVRFDYSGCGASEGIFSESSIGQWKKDVLAVLDELTEGPQVVVGSSMGGWLMLLVALARPDKIAALIGIATGADYLVNAFKQLPLEVQKEIETKGEWYMPNFLQEKTFHKIPYKFIKDAENHCVLHSAIPITCPMRLIHGLEDTRIPWQISMKVAEIVVAEDVDVILRKRGQHQMNEKDDIKLILNTIDDVIDKLTTLA